MTKPPAPPSTPTTNQSPTPVQPLTQIVNLAAYRTRQQAAAALAAQQAIQPDPDCVSRNSLGQRIYLFSALYTLDHRHYTVEFWATGWQDAERHLAALQQNGTVAGQVYSTDA